MAFIERISLPGLKPPTKLYLHESGYAEAFGDTSTGIEYVNEIFSRHRHLLASADYTLTALFGLAGKKIAEVFGYGGMNDWKTGNPTQYTWVFEDGAYKPEDPEKGCGEFDVARGREEEFRWETRDLYDFIQRWPELPERVFIEE